MTTVLASIVSCILAAQPVNAPLANGIYVVLWSGEGTTVNRADGAGTVVLGELASTAFGKASLTSVSNDNSKYRLELTGAGPFDGSAENHHFAIYIDGVCALVGGTNSTPHSDRTKDLGIIMFDGETNAETIGKALGVTPVQRHHPGYELLVAWHPVAASYAPGKPVVVRMEIKNVGKVPLCFVDGRHQRGPRNNQFGFMAYRDYGMGRAMPDIGSPENDGGPGSFQRLIPRETFTKEVNIADWFKFENPGSYRVTCLYRLELLQDGTRKTIWDEFAVGDCLIRISDSVEKPKP